MVQLFSYFLLITTQLLPLDFCSGQTCCWHSELSVMPRAASPSRMLYYKHIQTDGKRERKQLFCDAWQCAISLKHPAYK